MCVKQQMPTTQCPSWKLTGNWNYMTNKSPAYLTEKNRTKGDHVHERGQRYIYLHRRFCLFFHLWRIHKCPRTCSKLRKMTAFDGS